jgi:DNA-binding CsgD family transcriptional regulator
LRGWEPRRSPNGPAASFSPPGNHPQARGKRPDELTAQERQIARRARDGQSNTEIGLELLLSPRTVEWHLRKVFAKLGVSSRGQLCEALPSTVRAPLSA